MTVSNEKLLRDLMRLANDREISHRSRTVMSLAVAYIRKLEDESYTFDQFVAAAKSDNKKNVGKGRKFVDWMADIKTEIEAD